MKPTDILLHHSATKDGSSMSWDDIRRYHKSWRCEGRIVRRSQVKELRTAGKKVIAPWKDIGYQYGVEWIENSVEILVGRMETENGAHCYQEGMNRKAIGICIVGNFDVAPPPEEILKPTVRLVRSLMERYKIPVDHVKGHRDYAGYKTCPGKLFDLDEFRAQLH